MNGTAIAIRLKIPDNEAYTALTALQRLKVPVARVERADLWVFEGDAGGLLDAVRASETLYNPNKHEIAVRETAAPEAGETWIEELADPGLLLAGRSAKRFVAWRLFGTDGAPLPPRDVQAAADRLLCNPAIERAIL